MNGSLDPSFILPNESFLSVSDFHILSNDQLYLGGNFTTYNGQTVNRIVRLLPNGSIDTAFNTGSGLNAMVRRLLVQDNGDILVAGTFNTYKGSPVSRLIRLRPNGDRDTSFNAVVPSLATLDALAIDTTGRIYITGSDAGTLFLKRLLTDGSEDPDFNTGTGLTAIYQHSLPIKIITSCHLLQAFTICKTSRPAGLRYCLQTLQFLVQENIFTQDNVTIYPNPCTDKFCFRIKNASSGEIKLKVEDIHGRQIYEGKYNTIWRI